MEFHGGSPGVTLVGDAFGQRGAPPVLLLHGGGQTRHAWGGTAAALAAAGWHAVALDLRGHGESSWAPDQDYALATFAADVRAVGGQLGAAPAMVGASLGGLASLIAHGEGASPVARALILVDITPRTQAAGVERIVSFMTANPHGFATLHDAADAVAAYMPHRPRPKDMNGLKKNLRRGPDGRYRWHWDPAMMSGERRINATRDPIRLEQAAQTLSIPTLLVRGRMSELVSEEDARAFLRLVPHAQYVDVSDAGHMVAGDQNDPFTTAVVQFLATVDGR